MIHFYKYHGTANDFILVDNRDQRIAMKSNQIHRLCDRRLGIGADGYIELQNQEGYDFKMMYYNANGHIGTMCGNGARCAVAFAKQMHMVSEEAKFVTADGEHTARINPDYTISVKMQNVQQISQRGDDFVLDTGSPHYVTKVGRTDDLDVFSLGQKIRNSPEFVHDGINVNFLEIIDGQNIRVRTYERGVEDETYSCGTGVTASALVSESQVPGSYVKKIHTKGGLLNVRFDLNAEGVYENIWLTGPACLVFEGHIALNA